VAVLTRLEAYVLDSGAFVSLMAASLTASTAWVCDLAASPEVIALAGTATAAVYGLDRLLDTSPADVQNVPLRAAWVARHRRLLVAQVVACTLASAVLAALLPRYAQFVLILLGACTGVYGLRLIPALRGWATPVKPLAIGVLWAGGSVWVPHAVAGVGVDAAGWCLFAARGLHVVVGCLLFDLRDREGDLASGEHSWAVRWGRGPTLAVCWVATGAAATTLLVGVELPRAAPDLVTGAALIALLIRPRVELRRYCALGVDGALGLPGLVAGVLASWG